MFLLHHRHEDLEEEEEIMNITAQAHDQVRRQNHGFYWCRWFRFQEQKSG